MRHLERESEHGQLLQPRFAAARVFLDYMRRGRVAARAAPLPWERSMAFGAAGARS